MRHRASRAKVRPWKSVIRADLTRAVADKRGIPNGIASEILDSLLDEIIFGLQRDKLVKISGFGKFKATKKHPRPGRHLFVGEPVKIGARTAISFQPSAGLKQLLNSIGVFRANV